MASSMTRLIVQSRPGLKPVNMVVSLMERAGGARRVAQVCAEFKGLPGNWYRVLTRPVALYVGAGKDRAAVRSRRRTEADAPVAISGRRLVHHRDRVNCAVDWVDMFHEL